MFTGIITDTTAITKSRQTSDGLSITFKKPASWTDLKAGESIATNGVCLTAAKVRAHEYDCFLMPETLKKTAFGGRLPKIVNLERPLRLKDRFGGHFVQGHVDDVGKVVKILKAKDWRVYINFKPSYKELVIYKGSVALNGVALTIAEVKGSTICLALIPYTLKHTTLADLKVGDAVNLEFDLIGKYLVNITKEKSYADN